jgi:hypothetical protein
MIDFWIKKGFFRNANHAIWFINSMFFIVFYLILHYGNIGKYALIFPILFHTSPIINSFNTYYIKKIKSEVYSIDCIWFNAIMVFLYLILMYKF